MEQERGRGGGSQVVRVLTDRAASCGPPIRLGTHICQNRSWGRETPGIVGRRPCRLFHFSLLPLRQLDCATAFASFGPPFSSFVVEDDVAVHLGGSLDRRLRAKNSRRPRPRPDTDQGHHLGSSVGGGGGRGRRGGKARDSLRRSKGNRKRAGNRAGTETEHRRPVRVAIHDRGFKDPPHIRQSQPCSRGRARERERGFPLARLAGRRRTCAPASRPDGTGRTRDSTHTSQSA